MRTLWFTAVFSLVLSLCPGVRAGGKAYVLVTRVRFSSDAMTRAREALALTRLVEGEVSRAGLRMASEIDKLQSLESDRWKPLEQCGDSSCIADIAGASGMDYVLYTDAQDLGGSCVISASLVSARTSEKLGMETGQTETTCTPGKLRGVVVEAVRRLLRRTVPMIQGRRHNRGRTPGFKEGPIGERVQDWELGPSSLEIVEFTSEPKGAVVLLDGELLCRATPCSKIVAVGSHEVSMQKERYRSRTEIVTVSKGAKLSWKLAPDFGLLSVKSRPAGLSVKLDGKEIGKTPIRDLEVSPGAHEVLVSDPCFYDSGKRVRIERGRREQVDVVLRPRQGGIEVLAEDSDGNAVKADVLVDGIKVGTTPGRFKVSICASKVQVKHARHGSWTKAISVAERKVKRLRAVLKVPPGYVLIKPGTFMMGSPRSEPGRYDWERQHRVEITCPFYLKATEVTQGEWKALMGNNPSWFSFCGNDCPVENVSWYDAVKYCNALSNKEGLEECYFGKNLETFKGLSCKGYRLPTEAEWEYAARAGTTTTFHTGSCLSTDQANYDGHHPLKGCAKGEYRGKTVEVGSFQPNAWGLYDMHGNVWEWVNDWYSKEYPVGFVRDPLGPLTGSYRVVRGGGWYADARFCRSAFRDRHGPGDRGSVLGFRPARSAE